MFRWLRQLPRARIFLDRLSLRESRWQCSWDGFLEVSVCPPPELDLDKASKQQLRHEVERLRVDIANALARLLALDNLEAQLTMAQVETVEAFVEGIDANDPYTSGHSRRVASLSLQIGAAIDLSRDTMIKLHFAALLHDVGKISIAGATLRKTSRLDDDEFVHLKQHPITGERIVRKISNLADVAPMVRWHHERYDGRGYPDGLVGKEIPVESAIVCAADAYDAMTSKRPYGKPKTHMEAVQEIGRNEGTQFAPIVVNGLKTVATAGRIQSFNINEDDFESDFEIPEEMTF
jgi:HD-GYP domain-containing protein (c-di-GMP phosphodiesterase class II)